MDEENELEGLGGWLILVGFGVVSSPFTVFFSTFPAYFEMFSNGSWETLTTPGTEAYSPFWAPVILGEIAINTGLIFSSIAVAFLFFFKSRLFPWSYISLMLFLLFFLVADALVIKLLVPDLPVFDEDTLTQFVRSLVSTSIWVPYMLMSKRVKATFVN